MLFLNLIAVLLHFMWLLLDTKNYFKHGQDGDRSSVKLPIKWMAQESLLDGTFSEKSDVVSTTS